MQKSDINKILLISLSNIGDVILTFPVVDALRAAHPEAVLSVVVGPKARDIFRDNPHVRGVHVFRKDQSGWQKLKWVRQLRREKFDLAVDLRNTAIPFLVGARYKTPLAKKEAPCHMREKHLHRLRMVLAPDGLSAPKVALHVPEEDHREVRERLGLDRSDQGKTPLVAVAPGAAYGPKRWREDGFAEVCTNLIKQYGAKIVLVGDENDRRPARAVREKIAADGIDDLCGQTDLVRLAAVLRECALAVVNDSAVMHMASYLDIPTLAVFGPTDPRLYGPWSTVSAVVQDNKNCPGCRSGSAREHTCMRDVPAETVLRRIRFDGHEFSFSEQ